MQLELANSDKARAIADSERDQSLVMTLSAAMDKLSNLRASNAAAQT